MFNRSLDNLFISFENILTNMDTIQNTISYCHTSIGNNLYLIPATGKHTNLCPLEFIYSQQKKTTQINLQKEVIFTQK